MPVVLLSATMRLSAVELGAEDSIIITSTKSDFDLRKNIMFFRGHVKADDGIVKLSCNNMNVYQGENQQPRLIVCMGEVVIRKDESISYSDRAEYSQEMQTLTLRGNARVIFFDKKMHKKNIVRGRVIIYSLKNNSVKVEKSKIEIRD